MGSATWHYSSSINESLFLHANDIFLDRYVVTSKITHADVIKIEKQLRQLLSINSRRVQVRKAILKVLPSEFEPSFVHFSTSFVHY